MDVRARKGLLLVLWVAVVVAVAGKEEGEEMSPVVRVTGGALRGKRITRPPSDPLRTLYAFEGVPYARPPTGPLRFKDPEPADPWTGVRNATDFGPNCVQNIIDTGAVIGQDDCLYLNVYTIDPPSLWATKKRPVLVWIHGGGWVQWSGDTTATRPDPLLGEGLLFVSLNYRLGIMGFLNTEDAQAPGNAALKDQALALRWVRDNIAAFGGDVSQITIMGESAGAGCVHYHMLVPTSRGLFQRAVSVSGSVLPKWALVQNPKRYAQAIRRRFASACADLPDDAIVQCLQRVDATDLVNNQYDVPAQTNEGFFGIGPWRPSIEVPESSSAPFLTSDPEQMLRDGKFDKNIPYVTGFTSAEGILYLGFGRLLAQPERWADMDANFDAIMQWEMPLGLRSREVARQVRAFYFGNESLADANSNVTKLQQFVQMCKDVFFTVGTVESARLMAERGSTVYVYRFSRDGPLGWFKKGMNATRIPGVSHGDDMAYVFDVMDPATGAPRPVPASEQPLRRRQAALFANMVKFGNPTPAGSGLTTWPAFDARHERYLDMGESLKAHDHVLGKRIVFWRGLLAARRSPDAPATPKI